MHPTIDINDILLNCQIFNGGKEKKNDIIEIEF